MCAGEEHARYQGVNTGPPPVGEHSATELQHPALSFILNRFGVGKVRPFY